MEQANHMSRGCRGSVYFPAYGAGLCTKLEVVESGESLEAAARREIEERGRLERMWSLLGIHCWTSPESLSCAEARRAIGLNEDHPVLGLMPGSRREIERLLPVMLEVTDQN